MKFEKARNGLRTVYFEIEPQTKVPEQNVAINALGALTAERSRDPDIRTQSAVLACRINLLPRTADAAGETIQFAPSMPLLRAEATLLGRGLKLYIEDNPSAVPQPFAMGNPHGSNVRAVEGDMAKTMYEQLIIEFGPLPAESAKSFGFH